MSKEEKKSNTLFLKLETTGFAPRMENTGRKRKNFDNYYNPKQTFKYDDCRIVEIALIKVNENFEYIEKYNFIIKPDNFYIKNSSFHGITNELANKYGITFKYFVNNILKPELENVNEIVGYNVSFDEHILLSEIWRYGYTDIFSKLEKTKFSCLMETANFSLGLTNSISLFSLYFRLFGDIEEKQQAMYKCFLCYQCYLKLYDDKVLDKNFIDKILKTNRFETKNNEINNNLNTGSKEEKKVEKYHIEFIDTYICENCNTEYKETDRNFCNCGEISDNVNEDNINYYDFIFNGFQIPSILNILGRFSKNLDEIIKHSFFETQYNPTYISKENKHDKKYAVKTAITKLKNNKVINKYNLDIKNNQIICDPIDCLSCFNISVIGKKIAVMYRVSYFIIDENSETDFGTIVIVDTFIDKRSFNTDGSYKYDDRYECDRIKALCAMAIFNCKNAIVVFEKAKDNKGKFIKQNFEFNQKDWDNYLIRLKNVLQEYTISHKYSDIIEMIEEYKYSTIKQL
jgi:DNA polymerase III epsilon subunit-like protein